MPSLGSAYQRLADHLMVGIRARSAHNKTLGRDWYERPRRDLLELMDPRVAARYRRFEAARRRARKLGLRVEKGGK